MSDQNSMPRDRPHSRDLCVYLTCVHKSGFSALPPPARLVGCMYASVSQNVQQPAPRSRADPTDRLHRCSVLWLAALVPVMPDLVFLFLFFARGRSMATALECVTEERTTSRH